MLDLQEQVLPGWELVTWVERKPSPFKVSVHSGSPEWHKIHAEHPRCQMAAFMLAILAAHDYWARKAGSPHDPHAVVMAATSFRPCRSSD